MAGETASVVLLQQPFERIQVLPLAHALTRKWLLARQASMRLVELERLVSERTRNFEEVNARLECEIEEREIIAEALRKEIEERRRIAEALRKEIEERRSVTQALRVSEERFAKAFRSSPMPMAIQALDDQRYVDANERFLQMTGRRLEELQSPDLDESQLYVEPGIQGRMLAEVGENSSLRDRQCRLRTKGGQERQALVSMEFLAFGNRPHALILAQDITEHLSLEDQLRQAQKMASVGQLAAGIAHDFNNLLTVILGHVSQLLDSAAFEPSLGEPLLEVAKAAKRAASLTRQLLAFSRKQVLQPRALDLNEVIRNLNSMLTRLIGEHIALEYELSGEALPVFADAGSLEQVLVNLAVNARDAMPKGGRLRMLTSRVVIDPAAPRRNPEARPGPHARVTVTDTGCGMRAETLGHLFEPFFTTKEQGKGTGLGLASAYGILHQHHGWIEVDSRPEHGSTFTFFVPLTDKAIASPPPPPPKAEAPGHQEKILLVDDEPAVRAVISAVLHKQGYQVFPAGNGEEALEVWCAHEGRFDLVFTDMVMPGGISGSDLANRFLAVNPGIKILCSSGYSLEPDTAKAMEHRHIFFLPKPYVAAELSRMIRKCLQGGATDSGDKGVTTPSTAPPPRVTRSAKGE